MSEKKITIRLETKDDYRNVENLTREAFWNVYHWIYLMELVSLVPQYAILLAVYMLNVVQNNILIFSVIAVKGLLCLIIRFQVDSLMRSRYRNGK